MKTNHALIDFYSDHETLTEYQSVIYQCMTTAVCSDSQPEVGYTKIWSKCLKILDLIPVHAAVQILS